MGPCPILIPRLLCAAFSLLLHAVRSWVQPCCTPGLSQAVS